MVSVSVSSLSLLVASLASVGAGQYAVPHIRRASSASTSTSTSDGPYSNITTASPTSSWTDTVLFCDNIYTPSGTTSHFATSTCKNSCVATWNDYMSSLVEVSLNNFSYTSFISTYTYHNMTAQLTTACDGHPRIVGDLTTTATGTNSTLTSTSATGNFTKPTPSCVLAPSDCTSFYGMYGSTQMSKYCTNTKDLDCGQCTINGGTVQLIYFPQTATLNTSQNLCPTASISPGTGTLCPLGPTLHSFSKTNAYDGAVCDYALPNATSTPETAPYVVSEGQTFYEDKVYISLNTIVAKNKCGYVGSGLPGTLLTLHSSQIYTIGGYHHEFADDGYSFNYADLTSVPSYAYYMACDSGGGDYCEYSGTRYSYGLDYINGVNTLDFGNGHIAGNGGNWTKDAVIWDEAYAPTLLAPLELRTLQSAWSSCVLDLEGLYDPPKALTQALTEAGPSGPGGYSSTTAAPASSVTNTLASATALPVSTAASTTAVSEPASSQTQEPTSAETSSPEEPETTVPQQPSSSSQAQSDPPETSITPEQPDSTVPVASTETKADPASSLVQATIKSEDPQTTSSTQGIGGIIASVLGVTSSTVASEEADPTNNDFSSTVKTATEAVITAGDSTMTLTQLASGSSIEVNGETLSAGQVTTIGTVVVSAGASEVVVDGTGTATFPQVTAMATLPQVAGASSQLASGAAITVNGATYTASQVSSGGIAIAGSTLSQGAQVTISGQTFSAGPSGLVVGGTTTVVISQSAQQTSAIITIGGSTYAAATASSGGFVVAGSTISQGGQVTISGQTFSAGSSGLVIGATTTIAISQAALTTGAIITAGGLTYSAVEISNSGYVVQGSTISQGSAVTISGHTFSAGPSGVVVDATQTVQPSQLISNAAGEPAVAGSGAVFTIGSSTYTATAPSGSSGVVIIAGQTISVGGSAVTISGTVVSEGSAGVVVQGTSTVPLSRLSTDAATDSGTTASPTRATGTQAAGSSSASTLTSASSQQCKSWGSVAMLVWYGLCVCLLRKFF